MAESIGGNAAPGGTQHPAAPGSGRVRRIGRSPDARGSGKGTVTKVGRILSSVGRKGASGSVRRIGRSPVRSK